jgi:hypothetical protein
MANFFAAPTSYNGPQSPYFGNKSSYVVPNPLADTPPELPKPNPEIPPTVAAPSPVLSPKNTSSPKNPPLMLGTCNGCKGQIRAGKY